MHRKKGQPDKRIGYEEKQADADLPSVLGNQGEPQKKKGGFWNKKVKQSGEVQAATSIQAGFRGLRGRKKAAMAYDASTQVMTIGGGTMSAADFHASGPPNVGGPNSSLQNTLNEARAAVEDAESAARAAKARAPRRLSTRAPGGGYCDHTFCGAAPTVYVP